MSSIANDKNGTRRISFRDAAGVGRTIRLGKCTLRGAEAVRVRVDELLAAQFNQHAPSKETSNWLSKLSDRLHDRFVRAKLVEPRTGTTLKDWLDGIIKEKERDLKPRSVYKLKQTADKLVEYFSAEKQLNKITAADAAAWRGWLMDKLSTETNKKLSIATIRGHSATAKTLIGPAVKRGVIHVNPFADLPGGPTPCRYERFVTAEEIEKVINACPTTEWKVLFGLARYAGLRVPSETHRLTWADVDFETARLKVHCTKTEGHEGLDLRIVPIEPRLMVLLDARRAEAAEGETHLVTITGQGAVLRWVRIICEKAGVEIWKRLWQTLRSSCERDLASRFPQYAVSKWIGHSMRISERHYTNGVPEEVFERVTLKPTRSLPLNEPQSNEKSQEIVPEEVVSNATANVTSLVHETDRMEPQEEILQEFEINEKPAENKAILVSAGYFGDFQIMEPEGVEPSSRNRRMTASTRVAF